MREKLSYSFANPPGHCLQQPRANNYIFTRGPPASSKPAAQAKVPPKTYFFSVFLSLFLVFSSKVFPLPPLDPCVDQPFRE